MEEYLIAAKDEQSVGVFRSTIDRLNSENAWTVQPDTNGSIVR